MKWAALAVLLAACPAGDDDPTPDGGDGGDLPDHGLVVSWTTRPEPIPGEVESGLTLDAATLHLRNVRAIGDAGVGDPRTLAPLVDLVWASGVMPPELAFPDAPTGLYARMSFELDRGGGTYAYELQGTIEIAGTPEPYIVRDRDTLAVSFDYEAPITLPPGAGARIPVRLELRDVLRDLDFESAPVIGGRRVIETGDPQLATVRTELAAAFGVHSSP